MFGQETGDAAVIVRGAGAATLGNRHMNSDIGPLLREYLRQLPSPAERCLCRRRDQIRLCGSLHEKLGKTAGRDTS